MKRGFTLIELLGVIIILTFITLLLLPNVTNLMRNSNDKIDKTTEDIIYKAASLYISDSMKKDSIKQGSSFCIPLYVLVEQKFLKSPIKLFDNTDITKLKGVQVNYLDHYEYNIVDIEECKNSIDSTIYLSNKGYQEVEYLESDGNQYIDTGYFAKTTNRFVSKYFLPITSKGGNTFGSFSSKQDVGFTLYSMDDNSRFGKSQKNATGNYNGFIFGEPAIFDYSTNGIFQNGQLIYTPVTSYAIQDISLFLFACNVTGVASGGIPQKMYYFKIYDDNVLVRNFVPCYRKADNVIGMYDIVNDVFYVNLGSGEFIAGPDVN